MYKYCNIGEIMEKIKAIRAEIPEELYDRLKGCAKRDYSNVTAIVRSLIVDYVRENEERRVSEA